MYKTNAMKKKEYITPYTKETVENLLETNNIKLNNNFGYDAVYVANMAKADFYGSAIEDILDRGEQGNITALICIGLKL